MESKVIATPLVKKCTNVSSQLYTRYVLLLANPMELSVATRKLGSIAQ